MNKVLKGVISLLFIIVGIGLQAFGVYTLMTSSVDYGIGLFIFGFILYFLGRSIDNFRGFIIKLLTHTALFLLSLSFVLGVMSTYSDDVAESVQPSLDYILAGAIDGLVEEYQKETQNEQLTLILAENIETRKIYSSNITSSQATLIATTLSFENKNQEEQELLSQFLIKSIYETLQLQEGAQDVAIPLELLADQYGDSLSLIQDLDVSALALLCEQDLDELDTLLQTLQVLDPQTFGLVDSSLILTLCQENENAYINLLTLNDTTTKTINTKTLSQSDADLIWQNLNLNDSVSEETKQTLLSIGLTFLAQQQTSLGFSSLELPLASIASVIPQDIKLILSYDLLNPNLQERATYVSALREDCYEERIQFDEICEAILLTSYDSILANAGTLEEQGVELPIDIEKATQGVATIDEMKTTLKETTQYWKLFFVFFVLFTLIAFILRYFILKRSDEEMPLLRALHQTSREHFFGFLSYTFITFLIALGLPYLIDTILEFLSQELPQGALSIVTLIPQLPTLLLIETILLESAYLHLGYLLLALVLSLITFGLLHKHHTLKSKEAQPPSN